ncbi:MAG: thiamine diphosphokinase [Planctomycetia bacterium]|nr:thiamine diphosphokinase [Planctomycetia bacterium]
MQNQLRHCVCNDIPRTVILANGAFPQSAKTLSILATAQRLVCCDGAAQQALEHSYVPDLIVGDLDSLSSELREKYSDRIVCLSEQETNDLNKAFQVCLANGWRKLTILGATGRREDHTLGNIARLVDFAKETPDIQLVTDDGTFFVASCSGGIFITEPRAQVSIFSFDPEQEITSHGLKYPLTAMRLNRWYQATLNETLEQEFSLDFTKDTPILIYIADERK